VFSLPRYKLSEQFYIHFNQKYEWYLTAPLGLLFAFIGLNIQHDANHGAISRNPRVNRLLGLTQNWIGGSAVDWIHQHVVQHHVHTNDIHNDPDISGNTFLRLNPLQPLLRFHIFQHIYIFILIAGFGVSVVFTSMEHLFTGQHKTKMSSMLNGYRVREALATAPFFLRWFVLPLLLKPSSHTALNVFPMFMTGGFYLAFFFVISHNFVGVHMFDKVKSGREKESFLYNQVVSSCNVGGAWLAFLNGGLNYQIEHHLFPRVSHNHYAKIAPIVREFCKKKNIPYVHFNTISENMTSCVHHLSDFGHKKNPYPEHSFY
jgi:acyl-lipid (7-3)-desaturase (Delta-4 desaturase)